MLEHLARLLGLLDRHVGRRGRARLEEPLRDEPGDDRKDEEQAGGDQEAEPRPGRRSRSGSRPACGTRRSDRGTRRSRRPHPRRRRARAASPSSPSRPWRARSPRARGPRRSARCGSRCHRAARPRRSPRLRERQEARRLRIRASRKPPANAAREQQFRTLGRRAFRSDRSVSVHRLHRIVGGSDDFGVWSCHSGGSSSNRRRHTTMAARLAAMVATAPMAAIRPLHIRRLTISLSRFTGGSKAEALGVGHSSNPVSPQPRAGKRIRHQEERRYEPKEARCRRLRPGGARIVCPGVAAARRARPSADHTATDFTLEPASPEAGASVNASSSTTLSYGTLTEDVKKTIGHFAPGLLANPEAVPHCAQALWLADACPADTLDRKLPGDHQRPRGRERPHLQPGAARRRGGRLGIIVDAATGKLFLTAPFYVRTTGDYGLDGILDDIPRLTPGTQITKLSFTLFGTVNGRNFTRGPTSCSLKVSTGEAFGYEHNVSVGGPSSSYTPDRMRGAAVQAHVRHARRLARHDGRAPAPADVGACHPAARRGGNPRQRRHAAVRDRPAPRGPRARSARAPSWRPTPARRARRSARRTRLRRSSRRR